MASSPNSHGSQPQPSAPPLPDTYTETNHAEPVTGYPPVMGYPLNHDRTHVQPPLLPVLPPLPLPLPPPRRQPYRISRRCAMASLIAIVVVASLVSAIVRSFYQPRAPVVRVLGFTMSNYSASDAALTAVWGINVTVTNPSERMRAAFERATTCVNYRFLFTSCSETGPLELGPKGEGILGASITAGGMEQGGVDLVVAEMRTDRESGYMSFEVTLGMSAAYSHRLWWTTRHSYKVSCSSIRVGFGSGRGGDMVDGGTQCRVS